MARRPNRSLLAWSLVGLIGGHQAAYVVVYRDPAAIGQVLDATGHGWLWLAPLVLVAALATAVVLGAVGSTPISSLRRRFALLALIQSTAFLSIEIAERSVGGSSAGHIVQALVQDGGAIVLLVGVGIQVATAALITVASRAVEVVTRAFRHRTRRARRSLPAQRAVPRQGIRPTVLNLDLARAPRAPPACA